MASPLANKLPVSLEFSPTGQRCARTLRSDVFPDPVGPMIATRDPDLANPETWDNKRSESSISMLSECH